MSSSQGMNYIRNKRKYKKYIKNNMAEGFSTIEGNVGSINVNDKLRELELEYNKVLQQYTTSYERLIKTKMIQDIDISSLKGKTARYGGQSYFVTNRGVMRKILALNPNDLVKYECNPPEREITEEQKKKLIEGEPLRMKEFSDGTKIYQKCTDVFVKEGGIKIKNMAPPKNMGWLDDKGKLYQFKDPTKGAKGCSSAPIREIPGPAYILLKDHAGTDLGPDDECSLHTAPASIEVEKLNEKLMDIAIEMRDTIGTVETESSQNDNKIGENSTKIDEDIAKLNSQKQIIKELKKEIVSLDGNIRDSKYLVNSEHLKYVTWGISLATLIGIMVFLKK